MTPNVKVLLVDDHPVVREGLRTIFAGEPGIEVVGEASSGEEAIQKCDELSPGVILMDIRMRGMDGIEATQYIKRSHPGTSVIVLTMYDTEMYIVEAVRYGAAGYLTKDASKDLLCHAVRAVGEGGMLVRAGLLRQAIQGLVPGSKDLGSAAGGSMVDRLTPRELDVLKLLAEAQTNRDISSALNLAEVTVKKHVQSIIGKLGASDRTHAAILAVRLGLAPQECGRQLPI